MYYSYQDIRASNPNFDIETERWLPAKGYETYYEVSNWGNVRGVPRLVQIVRSNGRPYTQHIKAKMLSLQVDSGTGYAYAWLQVKPKPRNCSVHRLVGSAFLPNPDNLPMFNHIDGNKLNNYYRNLEPCTASYNIRESLRLGLSHPNVSNMLLAGRHASCKPVYIRELNLYFESATLCDVYLNLPKGSLNSAFQNKKSSIISLHGYTVERISRSEFECVPSELKLTIDD